MMIKGTDFVIFRTSESENGEDLAIKDSVGRFTLIHEDHVDELIDALVEATSRDTYPVNYPVTHLFDDD